MPIAKKPKLISPASNAETGPVPVDGSQAVLTTGGSVQQTLDQLRRTRGKNRLPTKQPVAIRLDPDVLAAFREGGRGWQTRINASLREWLQQSSVAGLPSPRKKPG